MAKVGVVIPVYKTEAFVAQTIEGLLAQDFTDWKAVIVDDGSPDRAADIAEEYAKSDPRLSVLRQANQGVSVARNNGIAHLDDVEFILFIDSDDVWEPDAIQQLQQALTTHPSTPAAHGLARFMSSDGHIIDSTGTSSRGYVGISDKGRLGTPDVADHSDFSMLSVWCFIMSSSIMIRNSVLKRIGGFDPSMKISEDWDLWLRIALEGPIVYVNKPVTRIRLHEGSATRNASSMRMGEQKLRRKWAMATELTPEQRRVFKNGHRLACFLRLIWARDSWKQGKYINATKQSVQFFRSYWSYLTLGYPR